jgi:hypothetical protein
MEFAKIAVHMDGKIVAQFAGISNDIVIDQRHCEARHILVAVDALAEAANKAMEQQQNEADASDDGQTENTEAGLSDAVEGKAARHSENCSGE